MSKMRRALLVGLAACGVGDVGVEHQALVAPPTPITGAEVTVATIGYTPAIASNGSEFLLVWSDGSDIRGTRIDEAGNLLDTNLVISNATGVQEMPQVASNGTDFLVVWADGRDADQDIYAARVSAAGVVAEPNGFAVYAGAHPQDWPHVASNGTDYLVTWETNLDGTNLDVYGQRVTAAGAVLDGSGIAIATSGTIEWYPTVGSLGGNYLVAWSEFRDHLQADLYARRIAADGAISDPGGVQLTTAVFDQLHPAIATNGTGYVVSWDDTRSGTNYDIYAMRVSPDLATLGPNVAISQQTMHQFAPAIASNGFDYFLAWQDNRGNSADIYGNLLSGDAVSAGDGFAITLDTSLQQMATAVAYQPSAHGYLLAYQAGATSTPPALVARFVRQCGDGVVQAGEGCDDGNLAGGDGCSQICAIESGWTCSGAPSTCTDIDECLVANGGCQQTCNNLPGSYECECVAGYVLDANHVSCSDVDECATANGGCGQTCANTAGGYTCSCGPGYVLDADLHACDDVNECGTANGGCAQLCSNTNGSFTCGCMAGYTLDADHAGCSDVDECATNNGGCSNLCTNSPGSFACSCASDQGLSADGKTCVACGAGHTGDGTTCADVNECDAQPCGAHASCANSDGSFTCSCDDGYAGDGTTCTKHDAGDPGGCSAGGGPVGILWFALALMAARWPSRRRRRATA